MSEFKLKSQIFLTKGETIRVDLEWDDELTLTHEDVLGKLEVTCVTFGLDRWATIRAKENVFFHPYDIVIGSEDREFEAYRNELEEFITYKAELSEAYESF